jgi:hypothetical protein
VKYKAVAAFILIAFVVIIAWGIFTKAGAHPLLIEAQYFPAPRIAPCPHDPRPQNPTPLKPNRRADA